MAGVVAALSDNANDAKTYGPKLEARLKEHYNNQEVQKIQQFYCAMHKLG